MLFRSFGDLWSLHVSPYMANSDPMSNVLILCRFLPILLPVFLLLQILRILEASVSSMLEVQTGKALLGHEQMGNDLW